MLGIMAGMNQKDSYAATQFGFFWDMTSMSFCIQRSAWFASGYMRCVSLRGFSGSISHVFYVKVFDVLFCRGRSPMVLLFS